MKSCQVRKGFFTLRRCGDPAAATCGACNRPICSRHLRGDFCVECNAGDVYDNDENWNEDAVYDYREGYWKSESYEPAGAADYDASDAAAFAAAAMASGDEDFDFGDDGGLLDS